jgi:hypothetical protein
VRRRAADKQTAEELNLRRYRCSATGCGWEGLLPRSAHRSRLSALARRRRRLLKSSRAALVPALAVLGLGAAVAAVVWQAGVFAPRPSQRYAPGEQHDGEPLPVAHALSRRHAHAALQAAADPVVAAKPSNTLALRHGCVWGQPGRNPYRGTVEQALRSAALPEEVVQSVAAQVRDGQPVDRLEIRNDGVHALASGRVFNAQNIAMTYGQTLCLSTRVNFVAGHSESAALYEALTASGRVVAVMVPEVCGNVSVLGQSDTAGRPGVLSARGAADDPAAMRWMPAVLEGPGMAGSGFVGRNAQDVPEPGTLACVLTALGLMGLLRGLRAVRQRRAA